MKNEQPDLVLPLLAYAAQRDISPERLCRLAGLDFGALQSGKAAPLMAKQLNDLWLNACHLSHDPLFGLHFGEAMQLAALGVVGQMYQLSRTVGEALTLAASLTHRLTSLFRMEVERTPAAFRLYLLPVPESVREAPFAFRQMMDFCMVFARHELDGLVLEKVRPLSVTLPDEVAAKEEYERILRCRVEQGSHYSIEWEGRYWDVALLTADHEMQRVWMQKAGVTQVDVRKQPALKEKVTHFLLTNAYLGIPTLEDMAANFNTSARSLQRRLQEEGVTYQQLADSIRKSLALHYLQSGQYPVKEISYMLGYNELSAFSRAFRRWTGTTPVSYRRG
jgi:AraC-like DNA-binding protein